MTFTFKSTLGNQVGNRTPQIRLLGPDPLVVSEGQVAVKDMVITDADSGPSALVLAATVGTIALVGGDLYRWTYTGLFTDDGIAVNITADDGANTGLAAFNLTVLDVNNPPVIAADAASITVFEGTNPTMTGTWSDPDVADVVTLAADFGFISDTGGGTWDWFEINPAALPFVPQQITTGDNGKIVTVTADDGLLQAQDQFTIFVNVATNHAPSISADSLSVNQVEGTTATNTGTWADVDGDTITLTESKGVVVKNGDGSWSWSLAAPVPGDTGPVTITADDTVETTDVIFQLNISPIATADVYVDNMHGSASDANAGDNPALPKATIQAAIDGASDGASDSVRTVIQVEGGSGQTYVGVTKPAGANAGQILFNDRQNFTLVGVNAPKIDGNAGAEPYPKSALFSTTLGLVEAKNSKNITIEGFDVINSQHCGITIRNTGEDLETANIKVFGNRISECRTHGILMTNANHNSTETPGAHGSGFEIKWNEITRVCTAVNEPTSGGTSPNNSVGPAGGECCTAKRMDNVEVAYNLLHHYNKEGIDFNNMSNGSIHHNEIRDRHTSTASIPGPGQTGYGFGQGAGIYLDGAKDGVTNVDVYSNLVSGDAIGLAIGSESGGTNNNNRFWNNIAFDNNTMQFAFVGNAGAGPTPGDSTNTKVWFNTFIGNSATQNVFKIRQAPSEIAGSEIVGNILYRPPAHASSLQMIHSDAGNNAAGFAGILYTDQIFYSGGTVPTGQYSGSGALFSNPLFEAFVASGLQWPDVAPPANMVGNPPVLNTPYRINMSSPATGMVNTSPAVSNDIIGVAIPSINSDAGAFQR